MQRSRVSSRRRLARPVARPVYRSVIGGLIAVAVGTLIVSQGRPASAASAFRLVKVASASSPIAVLWDPSTKVPLVVEKTGTIRALVGSPLSPGPALLDVADEVSDGGEQGLLGAAFSRDGSLLYVNLTNDDGDTEIREYRWVDGAAVPATKRLLITIDQPYGNHNGGHLVVDSTGLLWIGTGDGGAGGDPENRAQNLDSLLGKMLRIDPRQDGQRAYRIPAGNPFAGGGGRPEIWAHGLRNPWRYDIDESGRRLFIADVGQGSVEEVSVVSLDKPGANFGWKLREGSRAFEGGKKPSGAVDPITEYSHSDGCSVTGGVFYRGSALKGLAGRFLYGDYCKGWIASVGKRSANGPWQSRKLGVTLANLSSFNAAPNGEVWVTSTSGTIAKLGSR
jgi:glucose/arabinose dehydrogenase